MVLQAVLLAVTVVFFVVTLLSWRFTRPWPPRRRQNYFLGQMIVGLIWVLVILCRSIYLWETR